MGLDDIAARRAQQNEHDAAERAESRRQTRIGRFIERFQQAFGDNMIRELGVTVDAPDTIEPATATGTFEYQGKQHSLVCRRHDRGLWWFCNDTPLASHRGHKTNHKFMIDLLINAISPKSDEKTKE
jgi:hypothetical protein